MTHLLHVVIFSCEACLHLLNITWLDRGLTATRQRAIHYHTKLCQAEAYTGVCLRYLCTAGGIKAYTEVQSLGRAASKMELVKISATNPMQPLLHRSRPLHNC